MSRRQGERWAEQDAPEEAPPQAPEPPPPAPEAAASDEDRIEQLKDLASLKDQGALTDEEFAAEKARILGA